MNGLQTINTEQVASQAQVVDTYASETKDLLSRLASEVSGISSAWRGSSASNFIRAWEDVASCFDSYSAFIEDLGVRIKQSAGIWESSDS